MFDATPAVTFEEAVRLRAYAMWESEGHAHGRDAEHWRVSEVQLRAEIAAPPAPKKVARKAAPAKKAASAPRRAVAAEHRAGH